MQSVEDKFRAILFKYVPPQTVDYCFEQWKENPFYFVITKKRESRYGDYRFEPGLNKHTITVNGDLNPFAFLITYLHEIAHLKAQKIYHGRIKPHGEEWKNLFKALLVPLFHNQVFPTVIRAPLWKYLQNPKASSCSDAELFKALNIFDDDQSWVYLSDIVIGGQFNFNGKIYVKETVRRTRSLCTEVESRRQFYISEHAQVEPVR